MLALPCPGAIACESPERIADAPACQLPYRVRPATLHTLTAPVWASVAETRPDESLIDFARHARRIERWPATQRSAIETCLCHQHRRRPDCVLRTLACLLHSVHLSRPAFLALSESLLLPVCEHSLCLRRASSSQSGICQLADLPASARTPPRRLKKSRSSSSSPTVPQFACSANQPTST